MRRTASGYDNIYCRDCHSRLTLDSIHMVNSLSQERRMTMDVKEKLIELQMQAKIGWTKEEFADYLINNGITESKEEF